MTLSERYERWCFSRVQLSLAAALLTAANSAVLLRQPDWKSAEVVALCTAAQAFMAAGFIWMQMLVVAVMWNAGQHAHDGFIFNLFSLRVLLAICGFSAFLVIVGIALDYFPWKNIAVLSAPTSNALLLILWNRFRAVSLLARSEMMVLMNCLCCCLVIGAYTTASPAVPGPVDAFDWFQLGCITLFLGSIGLNWERLWREGEIGTLYFAIGSGARGSLLEILMLLGLGIFAFQVFLYSMHLNLWLFPPLHVQLWSGCPSRLIGALMACAAFALQVAGYSAMGSSWRIGIDRHSPGALVTGGVFAFSRNPVYLAFDLYLLGTFLINGTPLFLILALLGPIFLHAEILREERFLCKKYSQAYARYFECVPRYLRLPLRGKRGPNHE